MGKFKKGHKINATHDMSRTRLYKVWSSMRERCLNPRHHAYARYGGRGITVCDRWHSFENFVADMGERPPQTSIDRIDNNLGYSPDNCRWATKQEQQTNTRATHLLEYGGERLSISQWARKLNVSRNRIFSRLKRGLSVEEALIMPKIIGRPR